MPRLSSGPCEMVIDPQTGRVAELSSRGTVFVARAAGAGPLRFHLPLPDYEAHIVDAGESRPHVTEVADAVVLDYEDLAGKRGRTGVAARVEVRAAASAFELRCSVHNASASPIPQVFFPYVGGFRPIEGPQDVVTFGKCRFHPWKEWGRPNPDRRWDAMGYLGQAECRRSPNNAYLAGMKWMDYGGARAGVSLYSTENTSQAQMMRVSADTRGWRLPDAIDLSWYFYPYIGPGETWESPIFFLYPHEGDWRRGVLKFKECADHTFTPVGSATDRDATIGEFTFWMSWFYQDWRDVRCTYRDIPQIASEARAAGFREMTLVRGTELDFCLPHKVKEELGTPQDLREAVEESRRRGVNVIPFVTCHLIREDTIRDGGPAREWFKENVAGQRIGNNWTYDPDMTPPMPILQIPSRAAYYACPASRGWRQAYFEFVDRIIEDWGCRGLMFDESAEASGVLLCFNPLHTHRPGEIITLLSDVLRETRRRFADRFGAQAVLSGESQWDAATEWLDFTWDNHCLGADEYMAPFHMAFPRARQCMPCADNLAQINRIFTSGYWLNLRLGGGVARLGEYPGLSDHLAGLAAFKERFSRFFNRRDVYLYTLGASCPSDDAMWVRSHRCGEEALVLAAHQEGEAKSVAIELDVEELTGCPRAGVSVWSRTLERLAAEQASGRHHVEVSIPANDFVALHVEGRRTGPPHRSLSGR